MTLHELAVEELWLALRQDHDERVDHVQDWIGNRWPADSFPVLPADGWRTPSIPEAGDGFRAGPLEWAALAVAVCVAQQDSRPATLVEMGASQAPWCLSWVRAHRKLDPPSRAEIKAVAFEAGDASDMTRRFWEQQTGLGAYSCEKVAGSGLRFRGEGWEVRWNERAVAVGGGVVRFPDVDVSRDNGAQAVRLTGETDYRGVTQRWRTVQAVDPVEVLLRFPHVHLLHMDVQGGEQDMLETYGFEQLAGRLSVVMLGTHSRTAEALAFEHLPQAGLVLVDEEPCRYEVANGVERLVQDGEQLWVSADALRQLDRKGLLRNPNMLRLAESRCQTRAGKVSTPTASPTPLASGVQGMPAKRAARAALGAAGGAVRRLCRMGVRSLRAK